MLGCFSDNLCIKHALYADLVGAMMAIELVFKNGWQKWLDCDSLLVVKVFSSDNIVPWDIRNRWKNCTVLLKSMYFTTVLLLLIFFSLKKNLH